MDDYQGVLNYLNALKGRVKTPGRDGARAQGEYSGFCRGYALRGPDLIPDARSHSENVMKLQGLIKRWSGDKPKSEERNLELEELIAIEPEPEPEPPEPEPAE